MNTHNNTPTRRRITIDMLISEIMSIGQPGAGGLYTHSIILTPEIAEMLLEHNTCNRPLNERRVRQNVALIESGRWMANGTSISITRGKKIADGQHRLTAVVRTGISIPVVLVCGVADDLDTLSSIDQCGVRTVGDIISIERGGEVPPDNNIIAATNLLCQITEGVTIARDDRASKAKFASKHADEVAPWAIWASSMAARSAPAEGGKGGRSIGATALTILAVHMYRNGADPDVIQEFYQGVVDPWSLPTEVAREMSDNRRSLLEALQRRTRQYPLNRTGGGNFFRPILTEYATHIVTYNRYLRNDRKVQLIRPMQGNFRYLSDLPAVVSGPKVEAVLL